MSCSDYAAALVDEHLPPPPDLEAHLAGCVSCRRLARLHTAARTLRLPEPPVSALRAPDAYRGVVRRRQRRRQWAARGGAALALVLVTVLVSDRLSRDTADAEAVAGAGNPLEGVVRVADTATSTSPATSTSASTASGESLSAEVASYTRTRPVLEDPAYRAFGALASWVRPPESTALESEPFRTVLAVLDLSQSHPSQWSVP